MEKEEESKIEKTGPAKALQDNSLIVEELSLKLRELHSTISALRKEGKDPFIADYLLRNVDSKIKWALVNGHESDFEVIEKIMKKAEDEIKDASEIELVNVKKELQERVKNVLDEEMRENKSQEEVVEQQPVPVSEPEPESVLKPESELKPDLETVSVSEPEPIKEKLKDITLDNSEKFFYLNEGKSMKSIKELTEVLQTISEEEFELHMREYNNNFSKWIEFVFFYPDLAKKIKGVDDKRTMIRILKEEVEVE